MSKEDCVRIQEEVSWGRNLSAEAQLHVLSCTACTNMTLAFSKLDSQFQEQETVVPTDFVDRVMSRIEASVEESDARILSGNTASVSGRKFLLKFGSVFQLRPVQVTVAVWLAFSMSRAF